MAEHALFCQHKLDELRDGRHRCDRELQKRQAAGGDVKELESQLATLTEDLKLYEKEIERTVSEAKAAERTSVSLDMAKNR